MESHVYLLSSLCDDKMQDLVQILCYQRKLSVLQIFCNKILRYLLARLGRGREIRGGEQVVECIKYIYSEILGFRQSKLILCFLVCFWLGMNMSLEGDDNANSPPKKQKISNKNLILPYSL